MTRPRVFTITAARHSTGRPLVFHVHALEPRQLRRPRVVESFTAWSLPQAHRTAALHGWVPAPAGVERRLRRSRGSLPTPTHWLTLDRTEAWLETWTAPASGRTGYTLYLRHPDDPAAEAHPVATPDDAHALAASLGITITVLTRPPLRWPAPVVPNDDQENSIVTVE